MNFEQPNSTPERIDLPVELINLATNGVKNARKAQDAFTHIAEAMAVRGVSDEEKEAYLKILKAKKELHDHELVLRNYLKN